MRLFNGFQGLLGILLISMEVFGILSLAIKRFVSLFDGIDHGLVRNPSLAGENFTFVEGKETVGLCCLLCHRDLQTSAGAVFGEVEKHGG